MVRPLAAAGFLAAAVSAAPVPGPLPGAPVEPALTDAEIAELAGLLGTTWQTSFQVRSGIGWDGNLLLSDVTRAQSGFASLSLEGLAWRPAGATRNVEWLGFVSADCRRMFEPAALAGDADAFLRAEVRWHPRPDLRVSGFTQGYYLDTVLDLSTESQRQSTPLKNLGAKPGAGLRWEVSSRWWVEATGTVNFSHFQDLPENYAEQEGRLHGGWKSGDGSLKIDLGLNDRLRRYREREMAGIGGRPLPGTRLRYAAPGAELRLEKTKEWHGAWRVAATVAGSRNRDNGSGYFNYDLLSGSASAAWNRDPWAVDFSVDTGRYRWNLQTVGIGLDPPRRLREDTTASLKVTRKLAGPWFAFAEAEREMVSSNDPLAGYNLTKISAGFGWKL